MQLDINLILCDIKSLGLKGKSNLFIHAVSAWKFSLLSFIGCHLVLEHVLSLKFLLKCIREFDAMDHHGFLVLDLFGGFNSSG